jgi:hypothetical protein
VPHQERLECRLFPAGSERAAVVVGESPGVQPLAHWTPRNTALRAASASPRHDGRSETPAMRRPMDSGQHRAPTSGNARLCTFSPTDPTRPTRPTRCWPARELFASTPAVGRRTSWWPAARRVVRQIPAAPIAAVEVRSWPACELLAGARAVGRQLHVSFAGCSGADRRRRGPGVGRRASCWRGARELLVDAAASKQDARVQQLSLYLQAHKQACENSRTYGHR